MATPDPARTSEIIALWLLMESDLQEMNRRATSIATGSTRVLSIIESDNPEPDAAATTQAQMKAVGQDLTAINLKAISLGSYAVRIAELAKAEVASNQRQMPAPSTSGHGAMN